MEDVYAIKGSWPYPGQASSFAVDMVYNYFKSYPAAHQGYPKFASVPLEGLRDTQAFRDHAFKIFEFFDTAVRYVREGPYKAGCKALEERSGYYASKGYTNIDRFNSFREPFLATLKVTGAGRTAWEHFLDNIYAGVFAKFG